MTGRQLDEHQEHDVNKYELRMSIYENEENMQFMWTQFMKAN